MIPLSGGPEGELPFNAPHGVLCDCAGAFRVV
jgi:hypothetical protein